MLQAFHLDIAKVDLDVVKVDLDAAAARPACMHVGVEGAQIDMEWSGKRNDVGSREAGVGVRHGVQTPVSVRTSGRLISPASDSSTGLLGFGPSAVELKSTGP